MVSENAFALYYCTYIPDLIITKFHLSVNPSSYRLTSLISKLYKTMERTFAPRLIRYLESNRLLSHQQSGFRKQRLTTDHIIRLHDCTTIAIANEKFPSAFLRKHCICCTFYRHKIILLFISLLHSSIFFLYVFFIFSSDGSSTSFLYNYCNSIHHFYF